MVDAAAIEECAGHQVEGEKRKGEQNKTTFYISYLHVLKIQVVMYQI